MTREIPREPIPFDKPLRQVHQRLVFQQMFEERFVVEHFLNGGIAQERRRDAEILLVAAGLTLFQEALRELHQLLVLLRSQRALFLEHLLDLMDGRAAIAERLQVFPKLVGSEYLAGLANGFLLDGVLSEAGTSQNCQQE